ncbi:uncharacterized protein Dwil_GK13940 [Drosophila willistoni]|uniref:Uncharacterized protein n=1 Tax=Drosophila willistoni TaxID=7260 RepID=B4NKC9_DROWI|nr:uncharacterized protein LOC6651337 [Drosophila willistoni]EDW84059.1 uncharacterized protein Dwil_GK13940 [Drosophila willistoni]
MRHEQVVVDYWAMFKTSGLCLLLALCGYVLLKMIQTIFWLPGHLSKNQLRLEEMAKQLASELGEDERAEMEKLFNSNEPLTEERINQFLDKPSNQLAAEEPKKEL